MKFGPQRFNDSLALLLVCLIFALWAYVLVNRLPMDSVGVVIGSTISTLGIISIFYWRKKGPEA